MYAERTIIRIGTYTFIIRIEHTTHYSVTKTKEGNKKKKENTKMIDLRMDRRQNGRPDSRRPRRSKRGRRAASNTGHARRGIK